MRKSKILSAAVLALLLTATTYTAGTVSTAAKTNTAAVKNVNTENMEFTEAYVKEIGADSIATPEYRSHMETLAKDPTFDIEK